VTSDAPPPSAQTGSDESQAFVSLQGRFTISLPGQVSAYSGIGTNVPEGRIEGYARTNGDHFLLVFLAGGPTRFVGSSCDGAFPSRRKETSWTPPQLPFAG